MKIAVITGSGGLIGSEAVSFFADKFGLIVGIDNNLREYFFGESSSTKWNVERIQEKYSNYQHYNIDIRNYTELENVFQQYANDIALVVHAAAQPSHDWAAKEPLTDFTVNANGTLNLLELTRQYSLQAVFIFTSTNKVYGDTPNTLPLEEKELRWEINESRHYFKGIDESMNIDHCKHSVFGASKVAADIMVQEYGRYFNMKTGIFRGGCLTGPNHSGARLHGFLSYLMKCAISKEHYTILGYKGKQVRDNIHSFDVARFIEEFIKQPRVAEVYNIGGGKANSISILGAFSLIESISSNKMNYTYSDAARLGDHICYYSDLRKMKAHYPNWGITKNVMDTFLQIYASWKNRIKH